MPTPCTVTGTLNQLSGGLIGQGKVLFQLTNIGIGNPIGVTGTSIIPQLTYSIVTAQNGTFTVSLWGNDNINPANTLYSVTFFDTYGNSMGPVLYSITGASLNLNTAIATNSITPPVLIGGPAIVGVPLTPQTITGQPLTLTSSAPLTVNSSITAGSINNVIYVDGTKYTTLAQAFAACVAPNCTIDMRGASAATTLGSFDPGNISATILLGPFTYSLTQMTVRSGLHLIGMGSNITLINQASAGSAPFVLPTGGTYPANVAIHVLFKGFNLQAAPSSTTDGFSMVATQDIAGKGGGIWYSRWEDINIGSTSTFGRNAIRLDTTTNLTASLTGANQFLSFQDVFAFRAKNAPPVVLITGSFSGQISFNNCQFDGAQGQLDTNANTYNIRVDDGGTTFVPYSINMTQVTSQWAWGVGSAAIFLGGVQGFTCATCHFENDNGLIKLAVGAGGHGNWGVAVREAYITANVGVNAGNGFIADLGTGSGLDFSSNLYFGTPDAVFLGTLTYLNAGPNWNANSGTMEPWTQVNMGLGITVAGLPAVAANPGKMMYVTDSTAIAAEGQNCVGGGATKALAFSNGVNWKCF